MYLQATPMPLDTCSITRSCVWRAAEKLSTKDMLVLPSDLCIGITAAGEPCGRKVSQYLGYNHLADDHAIDEPFSTAQPFCDRHAALIVRDVLAQSIDANPQAVINRAVDKRQQDKRDDYKERGVVYFARRGNQVKIGVSINPKSRIKSLEMASGARFDEVVITKGDRNVEAGYHRMFESFRGVGEWFTMSPAIRSVMNTLDPFDHAA